MRRGMGIPCVPECEGRSPTCHAECEKYREYAEACAKIRKRRIDCARETPSSPRMNHNERKKLLRDKQGRGRK